MAGPYVEFPSLKSLRLPHFQFLGIDFSDDPTHVRPTV